MPTRSQQLGLLILLLVFIAFVLMIVGWGCSQFVIGLILRFGQSAEILAWGTLFVVMALSGVFNPVSRLFQACNTAKFLALVLSPCVSG